MRSIDIDLAVHKAIEDGRQSFEGSEKSILRRLLKIDRGGALAGGPPLVSGAIRNWLRPDGGRSATDGRRPYKVSTPNEVGVSL
jgi:hypothetical protein